MSGCHDGGDGIDDDDDGLARLENLLLLRPRLKIGERERGRTLWKIDKLRVLTMARRIALSVCLAVDKNKPEIVPDYFYD